MKRGDIYTRALLAEFYEFLRAYSRLKVTHKSSCARSFYSIWTILNGHVAYSIIVCPPRPSALWIFPVLSSSSLVELAACARQADSRRGRTMFVHHGVWHILRTCFLCSYNGDLEECVPLCRVASSARHESRIAGFVCVIFARTRQDAHKECAVKDRKRISDELVALRKE